MTEKPTNPNAARRYEFIAHGPTRANGVIAVHYEPKSYVKGAFFRYPVVWVELDVLQVGEGMNALFAKVKDAYDKLPYPPANQKKIWLETTQDPEHGMVDRICMRTDKPERILGLLAAITPDDTENTLLSNQEFRYALNHMVLKWTDKIQQRPQPEIDPRNYR